VTTGNFTAGVFAILLTACASPATKPRLVYGLGDDELYRLGGFFGYRVEALGMSEYSFTREKRVFHVWAHNHIPVGRRLRSDHPVILRYEPPGRRAPVESQLVIEHGVPFTVVEQQFADFIRRIETSNP
jgi:hypothetical protein